PPSRLPQALGFGMGAEVHMRRVKPDKERLAILVGAIDESSCRGAGLIVDRLHALLRQRPGIFDLLSSLAVCPTVKHATRTKVLSEVREIFFGRVITQLRLFLRVQVVEVAEKLVEPM